MKMYYKKAKCRIIMMVVLTMLLQIVGPVAQTVYAAMDEDAFRVVGERLEKGIAYIDWKFTLDLDKKVGEFVYTGNFTLKDEVEEEDLIADGEDGTVIGTYSISTEGKVTVAIYPELYEDEVIPVVSGNTGEEGELKKPADSADPVDPTNPTDPTDSTDPTKTPDPVEPEGEESGGLEDGNGDEVTGEGEETPEEQESTVEDEEISFIGKTFAMLASASDSLGGLFEVDEVKETKTFTGTIEVEGASEKVFIASRFGATSESGKDLVNIFTFVGLWTDRDLEDSEEGTEISDGEPVTLDENTKVTIKYNWDIKGIGAQAGDTASIKIPEIFDSAGGFPSSDIKLSDGTKVGTWTISGGYLNFTFDSGLDEVDDDDLEGTFIEFGFKLKIDEFEKDVNQTIYFGDSIDKEFSLIIKPKSSPAEAIRKLGIPDVAKDGENYKDAKNITWQIDILNTEETILRGTVLSEDSIPQGLLLNADSFKITELTIGRDGNSYPKGSSTNIENPSKGSGFEIELPDMKPYSGYRIEYTTEIADFSSTTFTNTANLSKGEEKLGTATTTVGTITRSAPLEKSGNDINADEIEWTINVNKGGISIDNPVVKDILPAGLSIKEVTVYKVTGSTKTNVTNADGVDISGFPTELKLPKIGPNDIYQIVYKTTVDYSLINGGVYKNKNTFINSATLSNNTNQIGEPVTTTVTTTRNHLLSKGGSDPVTYGDTISWTIKVNEAYHSISDAVLHDIIPAGLEFNVADVTIKKRAKGVADWTTLTDGAKPVVTGLDANRKVTITFTNPITEEYEVTYTTKIIDNGFIEGTKFNNKAWLEASNKGTGVGTGGTSTSPVTKELTPTNNSYTKSLNGSNAINYNDKTISWKIEIDPIKEPITELNIVDTFPNKGMIFLPDTLEIKKGTDTELTKGLDYTLSPNTENEVTGYQNGFTINFTDGTAENPILRYSLLRLVL